MIALLVGCSGPAEAKPTVDVCAARAPLFPGPVDESLVEPLTATRWIKRTGGLGSRHGPPTIYRRSVDFDVVKTRHAVRLEFTQLLESSNKRPKTTAWKTPCQVCGSLLACDDDTLTAVRIVELEQNGKPLRVLHFDVVQQITAVQFHLVRHGHEILLDFQQDPRKTPNGSVVMTSRRLKGKAEAVRRELRYTNKPHRGIHLDLPGDAGGFWLSVDKKRPTTGRTGVQTRFRDYLLDAELAKLHPDLIEQPANLEISPDSPGFNLPH